MQNTDIFVKEEEPPLPLQESEERISTFESGNVALVSRREGEICWTSVLYIRQHLISVQQKLDYFFQDDAKKKMYIEGPPGCGKTCFCLLWARLLSVRDRKRILVVQFRANESCLIWIREADGTLWRMKKLLDSDDLRVAVKHTLKKNEEEEDPPFDLCVHDGVLHSLQMCTSMLSTLNTAVANKKIGKVLHVTSLAFSLSTGGQNLDAMTGNISRMAFDSWTYTDYQEALQCKKFRDELTSRGTNIFQKDEDILIKLKLDESDGNYRDEDEADDDDDNENMEFRGNMNMMDVEGKAAAATVTDDESRIMEILKVKYFYAGGSAWFMFMFSIEEVETGLKLRLNNVKANDWASFATSSVSSGTSSSVNTLMQQFDKMCTPVSKYVLFYAYDKCKTELVKSVRAAAEAVNNPSLKGWAFELEQMDLIRLSLESVQADMNPLFITNEVGLSFCPCAAIDFDGETIRKIKTAENEKYCTIIWCLKWNQGCFDTAFLQNSTLVTLQFTVSEKHSFKPKYIRRLRDALQEKGVVVDNCVHVGVAEVNNFQFDLDTAGVGRRDNINKPEFTIDLYHSQPLVKKAVRQNFAFQANFPCTSKLTTVEMFPLAATKKRARQAEDLTVSQTIEK